MTPKEKAEYLVELYQRQGSVTMERYVAKQCALIAVDLRLDGDFTFTSIEYGEDSLEYWQQVKNEIELL